MINTYQTTQSLDFDDVNKDIVDIVLQKDAPLNNLVVLFYGTDGSVASRILSRKLVAELIPHLQYFAKYGELIESYDQSS